MIRNWLRKWLGIYNTVEIQVWADSERAILNKLSSQQEEIDQLKHDLSEQSKQVEYLRGAVESASSRRQTIRPKTWREFQQLVSPIRGDV